MPIKHQDAIALLKQDHKDLRKLLKELADSSEGAVAKRKSLLARLSNLIGAHTKIEEEIFYPAYHKAVTKRKDEKLYYEAVEEHHAADLVLSDIKKANIASLNFAGKAKVLKELIEHHAEEEEQDMFPVARDVLSKDELLALGDDMRKRKAQLMNGHSSKSTPSRRAQAQAQN